MKAQPIDDGDNVGENEKAVITIWSEIFKHKNRNLAIVLLSSRNEDTDPRIWPLSMLLSSVQCYSFVGSPTVLPTLNSVVWTDDVNEKLQQLWYIVRDSTGDSDRLGETTVNPDYIPKGLEEKFQNINQFVLPKDNAPNFETHINDLIQKIFGPEKLTTNKIKGEPMRVEQFFNFTSALRHIFKRATNEYDIRPVSLK